MNPRRLFLHFFVITYYRLSSLQFRVVLFYGFCFYVNGRTKGHNFFSSIKSTLILTFIIKFKINLQFYRTTLLYTYYLRKSWARSLESLLEGHNCLEPVCQGSRRSIIVCFLSLLAKAGLKSSDNFRSAVPVSDGKFCIENSWKNLRNKCVFGFYVLFVLWLECTIGDRHLC